MTLEPLIEASPAIRIHVVAAVIAFGLGLAILFRRKGTPVHRFTGYFWVTLMLVTALSSFAIHELRVWGEWSPIHLLSVGTIASLGFGVWFARSGRIRAHLNTMRATFAGALVIAGLFSFMPGRIMHDVLFSGDNAFLAGVVAGTPLWVWPLLAGLVLLLCVFALQYANGFVSAMMPQLAADTTWIVSRATAGSVLSGLVIGRSRGWHRALVQAA